MFLNKRFKFTPGKKTALFGIILITLLGLGLRIIGIDKANGMWLDEIVSYDDAKHYSILELISVSSPKPLYFVILHYWIKFFGDAEIIVRLLSVIFGTVVVPVMYFAGKELEKIINPEKTAFASTLGLLAAVLTAVNSFLIYYSQEIRQYSLIALLSALSLLYLLKTINKKDKASFIGFLVVNSIFFITHFISVIFIAFEVAFLILYLFISQRETLKTFSKYLAVLGLLGLVTLIMLIIRFIEIYLNPSLLIFNDFEVFNFDFQSVFIVIQNWFSPVLVSLYNNMPNFFTNYMLNKISLSKFLFEICPILISFLAVGSALLPLKKSIKPIHMILLIPFCYLMLVSILSLAKTYIIVSRYTEICVPFVILGVSYGLLNFKNKVLSGIFVSFLIGISLIYILFSPNSAPRLERISGHKTLAEILNIFPLNAKDILIFQIGSLNGGKYFIKKSKIYTVNNEFLQKNNINILLNPQEENLTLKSGDYRQILKNYIGSETYYPELEQYFIEKYYSNLQKGRYFVIVYDQNLILYTRALLKELVKHEKLYNKQSLRFMLYSKISKDLGEIAQKYLKFVAAKQKGSWIVLVLQK